MVVGLRLEAGRQKLAKEIIRELIEDEGIPQKPMEGGMRIKVKGILRKLMEGGMKTEIEGILQKLMEGGVMIKVEGILRELMEGGMMTEVEDILRKLMEGGVMIQVEGIFRELMEGGMMSEVEDILRKLMKGTQIKDEGIFQKFMTGGSQAHRDRAGAPGKGHAGSGRHEKGKEGEVPRGRHPMYGGGGKGVSRDRGEGGREGRHRPSVPGEGIPPGGRGGAGSSEVNTTGKEARASARAGFRPMELGSGGQPARRPEV